MMLLIIEGRVEPGEEGKLKEAYAQVISKMPQGIIETWLLNDQDDHETWNIVSVWRDRESWEEFRKGGTPKGIQIFREAGSEPTLHLYDVVDHGSSA